MAQSRKYWGFRIDTSGNHYPTFYNEQLSRGFLRQGWGSVEAHDLRKLTKSGDRPSDQVANLRMYNEVKKGDIVFVPRIPNWHLVAICEATDDWNQGYEFEIDEETRDFGHKFPVKHLLDFSRQNQHVDGDIRSTLKCRSRFWSMSYYAKSVKKLLDHSVDDLTSSQERSDRFDAAVLGVVRTTAKDLGDRVYEELKSQFQAAGWEDGLATGLRSLFPAYQVEVVGGKGEQNHGTDILITMPGPMAKQYGIAIQVKDWDGELAELPEAIEQVRKAKKLEEERTDLAIIERIVVVTGGSASDVRKGIGSGSGDVRIMGREELKQLMQRMAWAMAANGDPWRTD